VRRLCVRRRVLSVAALGAVAGLVGSGAGCGGVSCRLGRWGRRRPLQVAALAAAVGVVGGGAGGGGLPRRWLCCGRRRALSVRALRASAAGSGGGFGDGGESLRWQRWGRRRVSSVGALGAAGYVLSPGSPLSRRWWRARGRPRTPAGGALVGGDWGWRRHRPSKLAAGGGGRRGHRRRVVGRGCGKRGRGVWVWLSPHKGSVLRPTPPF